MSISTPTKTQLAKILLPRRRQDVLTRQRLLDQLYDMVDRKVVLVSAPAGYGKTTLLVDFAHDIEHPVCWYTLDESDGDPRVFFDRLILSLSHRFPGFGERTRQALTATTTLGDNIPHIVDTLLAEMADIIPQWFVLILDDYHRLDQVIELEAVLDHLTRQREQFLLIIASRSTIELPSTITLMARGEIGGIGQEALRFTVEEIQELLTQNYDIQISKEAVETMSIQSEGWITGVLLSAHTMWKGIFDGLARARRSELSVYEYLTQEVLAHQELHVQEFLAVSSTLQEMSPNLCEEALGLEESEHFLELLEDKNLFITQLDDEWYRYHHLFREYLQARLQQTEESRWCELHRRAADWFRAHDQPENAVHHYLVVHDYENAACVMGTAARDMFCAGRLRTLMVWGEAIPDALRERAPRLMLFQSRAVGMTGRWKEALKLTEIAERGYWGLGDYEGLAYALLQRCEIWQGRGKFQEALSLGQETLSLIEETDVPVHYEAHRVIGRACLSLGQLEVGKSHLQQALALCTEQGSDYARSSIQGGLADCLWRQGRGTEAVAIQQQVVETLRQRGQSSILAGALNDIGFWLYSIGRYSEAQDNFKEALALARQNGYRQVEALTLLSLSELTRDLGAFEQAIKTCKEGLSIADELNSGFLSAYGREALGLTYRCLGNYSLASSLVQQAMKRAEGRSEYEAGRYGASLGLILVEGGDDAGLDKLTRACEKLQQINARSELTRAQFFTAWALFQVDKRSAALTTLQHVLDAVDSLGQEFIVEGQRALPLLQYAHTQGIDNGKLTTLIDQVHVFGETAQAVLSRVPKLSETEAEVQTPLRIFGFGHGKVESEGKSIPLADWGVAARYMLFYVLMHRSRSRDQIAVVLWPELSTSKVKANFHSTKARLNRALGQNIFYFDGFYYSIHPNLKYWFDVEEFKQLSETKSVETLQDAIALYEDDFLVDCYADWVEPQRETLRRQFLETVMELAKLLLARRQYRQAIPVLHRGLQIDELREDLHRQLMRALALSGQRAQAIRQYQYCTDILKRELQIKPSQATRDLFRYILDEQIFD